MSLVLALLTSKTAIVLTLAVSGYQTVMGASTLVLVGVWGLFAAAVIGRAVRQYNEPDAPKSDSDPE